MVTLLKAVTRLKTGSWDYETSSATIHSCTGILESSYLFFVDRHFSFPAFARPYPVPTCLYHCHLQLRSCWCLLWSPIEFPTAAKSQAGRLAEWLPWRQCPATALQELAPISVEPSSFPESPGSQGDRAPGWPSQPTSKPQQQLGKNLSKIITGHLQDLPEVSLLSLESKMCITPACVVLHARTVTQGQGSIVRAHARPGRHFDPAMLAGSWAQGSKRPLHGFLKAWFCCTTVQGMNGCKGGRLQDWWYVEVAE